MMSVLELQWRLAPCPWVHFPSQRGERSMSASPLQRLPLRALGYVYSDGVKCPLTDLDAVEWSGYYEYAWCRQRWVLESSYAAW